MLCMFLEGAGAGCALPNSDAIYTGSIAYGPYEVYLPPYRDIACCATRAIGFMYGYGTPRNDSALGIC